MPVRMVMQARGTLSTDGHMRGATWVHGLVYYTRLHGMHGLMHLLTLHNGMHLHTHWHMLKHAHMLK